LFYQKLASKKKDRIFMLDLISPYLDAVSADAPCGADLEFEVDALVIQAEGQPEKVMGSSVIAAVEPDWKVLQKAAFKVLERSRDVRLSVLLTRVLTHTHGFVGLDQGVSLTNGLLQRYWEQVHPQEDEGEFIGRINVLKEMNEFRVLLSVVRLLPLTQSRMGRFSLRDIELAEGKVSSSDESEVVKASQISAAFQDTKIDVLQKNVKSIAHALDQVQSIGDVVSQHLGAADGVDLSQLVALLRSLLKVLEPYTKNVETLETVDESDDENENDVGVSAVTGGEKTMAAIKGISGREDVVKSLEAICDYFAKYEPSSPVPLLLVRAAKMVNMDFKELLNELAPDGLSQAENVYGKEKSESKLK